MELGLEGRSGLGSVRVQPSKQGSEREAVPMSDLDSARETAKDLEMGMGESRVRRWEVGSELTCLRNCTNMRRDPLPSLGLGSRESTKG